MINEDGYKITLFFPPFCSVSFFYTTPPFYRGNISHYKRTQQKEKNAFKRVSFAHLVSDALCLTKLRAQDYQQP